MRDKEKIKFIVQKLKESYPDARCMLEHENPLQLLIATRLSAQCTDERVNKVTPALFERYKTVADFAQADISEVEQYIKSCGLYKTKAKDIVQMCKKIYKDFDGEIPDNMKDLTSLPGVGRKTANLVLGDVFHKLDAVVVDTHCIRITAKLGFHSTKDATKIEHMLREILPEGESVSFCHRIVKHGRTVCTARNPKCDICCLKTVCKNNK